MHTVVDEGGLQVHYLELSAQPQVRAFFVVLSTQSPRSSKGAESAEKGV